MVYPPTLLVAITVIRAPHRGVKMARWTSARRAGIAISDERAAHHRPGPSSAAAPASTSPTPRPAAAAAGISSTSPRRSASSLGKARRRHRRRRSIADPRRPRGRGAAAHAGGAGAARGFYRLFAAIAGAKRPTPPISRCSTAGSSGSTRMSRWSPRETGSRSAGGRRPRHPMRSCAGWCARRSTC